MNLTTTSVERQKIRATAEACADFIKLPFRNQVWKGQAGDQLGSGTGNSLDFQDHRAYTPGDDPRHINWQAYARTGNYSMKLYREEVRPLVDLIVDGSDSMFFEPAKEQLSIALIHFAAVAANRAGASLRCFFVRGRTILPLPEESLQADAWPDSLRSMEEDGAAEPPALEGIPLRPQALRIFVSDLLFPASPGPILSPLTRRQGRGLVFAPFSRKESAPDWTGNYEFVDAESRTQHPHRVEASVLTRYLNAYQRHFDIWKTTTRKHGIPMVRVPAERPLDEALRVEGLAQGAIEIWT
ncbi:MAG: DUF58 domain-containing protein [Verrucomicrobiota bacterium]